MHQVSFMSQRENVLPDIGCGIASLMMLLRFHCKRRRIPSYEQLAHNLRADKLPSEKGYYWYADTCGKGAYIDDVCLWLLRYGFAFQAMYQKSRFSESLLLQSLSVGPVMVGMKWHGGHWVVLVDFDGENITMFDPLRQSSERYMRCMTHSTFFDAWQGRAISVLERS